MTPRIALQWEKWDFIDHALILGAVHSLCSLKLQIPPPKSFLPFPQIVRFTM